MRVKIESGYVKSAAGTLMSVNLLANPFPPKQSRGQGKLMPVKAAPACYRYFPKSTEYAGHRRSNPMRLQAESTTPNLRSMLSTAELARRPSQPPNHEAENNALIALARSMAASPEGILQELADTALALCRAHSAGLSQLEEGDQKRHFHWAHSLHSPKRYWASLRCTSRCLFAKNAFEWIEQLLAVQDVVRTHPRPHSRGEIGPGFLFGGHILTRSETDKLVAAASVMNDPPLRREAAGVVSCFS